MTRGGLNTYSQFSFVAMWVAEVASIIIIYAGECTTQRSRGLVGRENGDDALIAGEPRWPAPLPLSGKSSIRLVHYRCFKSFKHRVASVSYQQQGLSLSLFLYDFIRELVKANSVSRIETICDKGIPFDFLRFNEIERDGGKTREKLFLF